MPVRPTLEKSKMCYHGDHCFRKETCSYAHTLAELNPPMCQWGDKCRFFGTQARPCQFFHPTKETRDEWIASHQHMIYTQKPKRVYPETAKKAPVPTRFQRAQQHSASIMRSLQERGLANKVVMV